MLLGHFVWYTLRNSDNHNCDGKGGLIYGLQHESGDIVRGTLLISQSIVLGEEESGPYIPTHDQNRSLYTSVQPCHHMELYT